MGRIVVGVDESAGAAAALRWAVAEGGVRGWDVVAFHAWHVPDGDNVAGSFGEAEALAALDASIASALGTDAAGAAAARAVQREVVETDRPANALLEASAASDLLVVGERGLGGFRGLLLGSVSQRIVHESHVPVTVVRERDDASASFGRVVAGIDGSAEAAKALAWAVAEARARRATLEVVHGWRLPAVPAPLVFDADLLDEAARSLIENAVEQIDSSGLTVEQTASPHGGAGAVLDAAEHADLVVVGSRGSSGLKRLLLGSVSTQIAMHAPCTVVVIPSET